MEPMVHEQSIQSAKSFQSLPDPKSRVRTAVCEALSHVIGALSRLYQA